MIVSTKGRYALRLVLDIAMQEKSAPVSLHSVAERQHVSLKYLEQVVSPLVKGGFLKSVRGASGGYLLACDPKTTTAGDILRCGEGELAPVTCLHSGNECEYADTCITLPFWKGLDDVITEYVDSVTIAELAAGGAN